MRYLVSIFLLLTLAAFQTVPSTRDISVTSAATHNFPGPGGNAAWVSIKNDCSDTIYFDLRSIRDADALEYPIRLGTGESFTMETRVAAVGASVEAALGDASCTVTIIFGR